MRLLVLIHVLTVYASAQAAASGPLFAGLNLDLVLFAMGVGGTGGITMRVAAYDGDEITRSEFLRKVLPSAWIGAACGFVVFLLCVKFRIDTVTAMMLSGCGGLAGREIISVAKAAAVKLVNKLM